MDLLNNISCCFDTSKDLAETGLELVVCDIKISKRCCVRWETVTYVVAMIFSVTDLIADIFGYVSFVNVVDDKSPIEIYIWIWLTATIISCFVIVSEIALPIYTIRNMRRPDKTEEQEEKFRLVGKYWSRANNVLVILTEDGVIAAAKILIAFRAAAAVEDLQTTTGVVTSTITFTVTILRHCLLVGQIVAKLSRNGVVFSKRPPWEDGYCVKGTVGFYVLFFTTLFLSCVSLALTGMAMTIALDLKEIHLDDRIDFLLNITLLLVFIPGAFIFSVSIIVLARW